MTPSPTTASMAAAAQVSTRGTNFWLPLLVAASVVTFAVGVATGFGMPRAAGPGTGSLESTVADVARNSMSDARWQALYGPTAGTWGVADVARNSMSDARWQAMYGQFRH